MTASDSCLAGSEAPLRLNSAHKLILTSLGNFYCRVFHRSISRPVGGKYRCWRCLREFELGW